MSIFGFSIEPSSGDDFRPIVKYNATAGRFFRIDRTNDGNGFVNEEIDITASFRAVFDFENVEVGWAKFMANTAPSIVLVPMGQMIPDKPSPDHKNIIRVLIKLNKTCGGDKQVREFTPQAKSALAGIEQVYEEYKREKAKYPGQLPVIALTGTTPVTTGNGQFKRTNYRPVFKIEGWTKRPEDLVYTSTASNGNAVQTPQTPQAAPATGHQTVPPPNRLVPPQETVDNDFG